MSRLEDILRPFDATDGPVDEHQIAEAIRRWRKSLPDEGRNPDVSLLAESMAFDFCENYRHEEDGWGTYYGPMFAGATQHGRRCEWPSIQQITPQILEYWARRAIEARHPVLRARYADVAWEFWKAVNGKSADFKLAQIAIDSTVRMGQQKLCAHDVQVIKRLGRALALALSLNDAQRVEAVRDAILAFEDSVAKDELKGLWGFSFDLLLENKKVALRPDQRDKILSDLEARMDRLANATAPETLDPFGVEAAAMRLARYYRRIGRTSDMHRVLRCFAEGFGRLADKADDVLATAWLHKIYAVLTEYGMNQEADEIGVKLRDRAKRSTSKFAEFSHEVRVTKEEMDAFVAELIDGSVDRGWARVAFYFVPKKDAVMRQLKEISQEAVMMFLLPKTIVDHDGRPVAHIGSLESDPEGHVVLQIGQNMQVTALWLRAATTELIRRFSLSHAEIMERVFASPIFDADRRAPVEKGAACVSDRGLADSDPFPHSSTRRSSAESR